MRIPRFLLRETLTITDFAGSGARGPVYGPARSVRASVQSTTRTITDPRGNDVTIEAVALIRPEDGPVPPETRVQWRDLSYRVLIAHAMPDTRRPTHWELSLARLA